MDDLDRRILTELQESFPLEKDPYSIIAGNLGISQDELWERVTNLIGTGAIRRIGFSIDSRRIGYASTLAAVRVEDSRVEEATKVISDYPQVTHSYLRENEYNIWFTVIAEDVSCVSGILEQIRQKLSLNESDVLDLPVEKLFKLDARFK
jgi:DNA-binding Lrp family transcriptional regulator